MKITFLKALSNIVFLLGIPFYKAHISIGYSFYLKKDFERAKFYFLRAKKGRCPDLFYILSLIHSSQKDVLSARECLVKAAQLGHIEAAAKLGFMLKESKKFSESIEWLSYAAAQGHIEAGQELRKLMSAGVMH